MPAGPPADRELAAVAAHVVARAPAILKAWRTAVESDPALTTPASLPRAQFYDHIPHVLEDLARRLCATSGSEHAASKALQREDAAAHGLQRWQQGYDLREVTHEWGHLQLCLADELEAYAAAHPELAAQTMPAARRALIELCNFGISESTAKYFQLRQEEAEGNARDLEQALTQARDAERDRSELWREAAHDLRGNLGVVANATAGLTMGGVSSDIQSRMLRLLQQSVTSLREMLDDVTRLARLQAGQEHRDVRDFDAAEVLRELADSFHPLASRRDLSLQVQGPATLHVSGDAVKVRRIAQNLLMNALKYTSEGGIVLTFGDSRENDNARWMFCVQDTGPGFHAGPGAPLAGAIEEATEEARYVEARVGTPPDVDHTAQAHTSSPPDLRPVRQERGEGIGLSIVKRLCELLDATVEMESEPGTGTIVRVLVPRTYPDGPESRR